MGLWVYGSISLWLSMGLFSMYLWAMGLWLSMGLWAYSSVAVYGPMCLWGLLVYGSLWVYGSMGLFSMSLISYTVMWHSRNARMMAHVIIFLITPAGLWPDEVPDKSVTSRYRYTLKRFVRLSVTRLMAEPRTNRRLRPLVSYVSCSRGQLFCHGHRRTA
jgi:hypothetical protein